MKPTRSISALCCFLGLYYLACGNNGTKSAARNDGEAGATAGVSAAGTAGGSTPNATGGASHGGNNGATGSAVSSAGKGTSGGLSGTGGANGAGGAAGMTGAGGTAGEGNAGSANAAGSNGSGNTGGSGGQPAGGTGGSSIMGTPGPPLTDPRDNATYDTVVINGQTWMAENLNYATATGSWCQDEDPAKCALYGRFYDWSVALGLPITCDAMQCKDQIQAKQQGVCPAGWHVTTNADWSALFMGVDSCAMAKASTGWETGAGNNAYGFGVLPTGYRTSLGFKEVGVEALYWTTNDELPNFTRAFGIGTTGCASEQYGKNFGLSVRCIKD